MGGGAWPFVVGGLSCQVYSGNERDLSLLNREIFEFVFKIHILFLEGLLTTT